jgi:hypothetical protein
MLSKAAEEPKLPSWHVAEGFALAPLKINLQAEANASAVVETKGCRSQT